MENIITQIIDYLWTQSWHIVILAIAIAALSLMLKNKSAHIRYLLWLILLVKCFVPPLMTITLAILPQQPTPETVITPPLETPTAAVIAEATEIMPAGQAVFAPIETAGPTLVERLAQVTLSQWLVLSWIVGIAIFSLIVIAKALRINRWLKRQRKPLPGELRASVENLFSDLDVKAFPKVWLVDGIGQPFVWGILRGSIYLPTHFADGDNADNQRGVLGHELSHVIRFDAAVNLLQIIAQAVFWFHPAIWWANKKIRAEREKCCDEMAIARLGAKAKDYSTAIVNTLINEYESALPVPSLAIAGPVKNIEDRIKTIMSPNKKFYKRPSVVTVATVLLLAAIAVPTTLALSRRPVPKEDYSLSQRPEDMVGTWFFENPFGDEEQMAIFHDGRVVVSYSNGHKDKVRLKDGFIVLPEFGNVKTKIAIVDNNTLIQLYESTGLARKWVRIDTQPHEKLLRSLTGSDKYQANINPRDVVESFIAAALAGYDGKAAKLAVPESAVPRNIAEFREALAGQKINVLEVYTNDEEALAITSPVIIADEGQGQVVFQLERENGNWLVRDIDFEEPQDALEEFARFMEDHPQLKRIPAKTILTDKPPIALDLDSGKTLELKTNWPIEYDIAWDNDAGGTLMTKPSSGVKMLALKEAQNYQQAIALADQKLVQLQTSTTRGILAQMSRFVLVKTSQGNTAVIEITDFDPKHAELVWTIKRSINQRVKSALKLQELGKACIIYANDNEEKYPDTMQQLQQDFYNGKDLEWLMENVEYLGKGKTARGKPDTVLAYDKTLLQTGNGTNVLFNDGHVSFEKPEKLGNRIELQKRVESQRKLSDLSKCLLMYATENDEKYPDNLNELLKVGLVIEDDLAWLTRNIEYLGDKVKLLSRPDGVLAYDKTLLLEGNGTNVLFNDSHVAFEKPKRLEQLGIKDDGKSAISVEARFILTTIDVNEMKNFLEKEKIEIAADQNSTNLLNDEQAAQFSQLISTNPDTRVLAAPKIMVFDGEAASIATTQDIHYVSAYTEPNTPGDYYDQPKPKTEYIETGVRLTVTPTLQTTSSILLDIDFEISELLELEEKLYLGEHLYQIPKVEKISTAITAVINQGQTLLIGGNKFKSTQDAQTPAKYLFVLIKAQKNKP